jgi:diguanylate cyclase (GGDEF)-like protein/PAS domain S-box-containing protein
MPATADPTLAHAVIAEGDPPIAMVEPGKPRMPDRKPPEGEGQAATGSAAAFSVLFDAVSDFLVRFLPDGTILHCNRAYARLHGVPREDLIGTNLFRRLPPAEQAGLRRHLATATPAAPQVTSVERRADGRGWRCEEWTDHALFDPDGRVVEFQSVGREVTARVAAEERLRESEERYRALVQMSPDGVFIVQDGRLAFANQAGARLLGFADAADVVGACLTDFVAGEERARVAARLADVERTGHAVSAAEWRLARRDGSAVTVESASAAILWEGRPAVQVSSRDVGERKAAQAILERMALQDHLTGLANRAAFERELERACARARRAGTWIALLFVDLDGFKAINDRLGHAAGDEILRQVARRLQGRLRETDIVARFGGDEFTVIAADHAGPDGFQRLVDRIERLFAEPFTVADRSVTLGASIGVALHPRDAWDAAQLLARADAAMYAAKRARRGNDGRPASPAAPAG